MDKVAWRQLSGQNHGLRFIYDWKKHHFFGEELRVAAIALKENDEKNHELQLANIEVQYSLEGDEKAGYPVIVWRQLGLSFIAYRQLEKRFSALNTWVPREKLRFTDKAYGEMDDCITGARAAQAVLSRAAETKLFIWKIT